ncbi:hypothetical protein B0J13DRAFT_527958 [Dactylonectria estremocensis]|uniref:Zn(2)-C6 fungal-type domain-containing protein n=1 Tax=Dactylonectria estremocensis TaxID=1079267 RepID=A0A9P9EGA0_9HYPO|nr:hypothetical protein B0J13DRAFT_527958 [Dactylonectria estremocensis]
MPRSRSGCLSCKKRKRKCDEQRPGCQACARRGIQCEGYATPLRWAGGIAVRGRFAGVSIPDAAAVAAGTAHNDTTSNTDHVGDVGQQQQQQQQQPLVVVAGPSGHDASRNPISFNNPASFNPVSLNNLISPNNHLSSIHPLSSTNPSPSLHNASASVSSPSSAAWGSISSPSSDLSSPSSEGLGTERDLFAKFLHSGLRRLYTTEATCWIQPHFEEMALQSPALVRVSAAIQAYLDDGSDGPSVQSMEHVDLALQTFRHELTSRQGALHGATLCAGLLLCTLRLLQAQPWTAYIDLIVDAYNLRTRLNSPESVPIDNMPMRHNLEVLGVMDIPSMVIGRVNAPVGIWKQLRKLQDSLKDGRLGGVEIVSGLPRSLLDTFANMRDNDVEYTENRFWTWPGEVGEYLQVHLWDCWRFSGILEVRRRKRLERKRRLSGSINDTGNSNTASDASTAAPGSELILCRLIASMDALNRAFELPQNEHLLVHNGLMFPVVTASLEVELLRRHPKWRRTLHEVRMAFLRRDSFKLVKVTFGVLDDAWRHGTSEFDVDEAARSKGVEIAVY